MYFLIFDVINNPIAAAYRAGKCPIPFLPSDKGRKFTTLLHPDAGRYFYVFHKISQRYRWMQIGQDMDMVFHPIDAVEFTFFVFDYTGDVLIQLFTMCFCNCRMTVLGAEDDVIIYLTVATHYAQSTPAGLSGLSYFVYHPILGWLGTVNSFGVGVMHIEVLRTSVIVYCQ